MTTARARTAARAKKGDPGTILAETRTSLTAHPHQKTTAPKRPAVAMMTQHQVTSTGGRLREPNDPKSTDRPYKSC